MEVNSIQVNLNLPPLKIHLPDDEDEDGDAVQAEEIPSKQAVAAGGGAAAAASEEALAAASMAPCTPLWRSGTDSEPEPGGAAEVGLPPPPVGELRTDAPATVALLRLQCEVYRYIDSVINLLICEKCKRGRRHLPDCVHYDEWKEQRPEVGITTKMSFENARGDRSKEGGAKNPH